MCVLAFAWQPNSSWRLVVAGNRDELHSRPAEPLRRWDRPANVLAGRDLLSGGTWMGVSEQGRFAVVTNISGQGSPDPKLDSRGALVVSLLADTAFELDASVAARFNPFNLITAYRGQANFFANRPGFQHRPLKPGIYGLSNADLDDPWPKTVRLRSGVEEWLADPGSIEDLLDLLTEGRETPRNTLIEPDLSPLFIRNSTYGTRCSTVVLVDSEGHGTIMERSYSPDAAVTSERELSFRWPS